MATAMQTLKAEMLARRLPPGPVWTGDTVLPKLLLALAADPAREAADLDSFVDNFFPDTATDFLSDWERVLGLSAGTLTVDQRRAQIIAKLRGYGDPTVRNLQAIADTWDLNAVVESHPYGLFRTGHSTVGEPLRGDQWVFTPRVTYDGPRNAAFEAAFTWPDHVTPEFVVRP